MKLAFTAFLLFFALSAFAQDPMYTDVDAKAKTKQTKLEKDLKAHIRPLPINPETNIIEHQQVVSLNGKTKEEIYIAARSWFAKTFNSANDVLQMDNEQALIGKGSSNGVKFTISIEVKDGKYRYTINHLFVPFYGDYMRAELFVLDESLYDKKGKINIRNAYTRLDVQDAINSISASATECIPKEIQTKNDW